MANPWRRWSSARAWVTCQCHRKHQHYNTFRLFAEFCIHLLVAHNSKDCSARYWGRRDCKNRWHSSSPSDSLSFRLQGRCSFAAGRLAALQLAAARAVQQLLDGHQRFSSYAGSRPVGSRPKASSRSFQKRRAKSQT